MLNLENHSTTIQKSGTVRSYQVTRHFLMTTRTILEVRTEKKMNSTLTTFKVDKASATTNKPSWVYEPKKGNLHLIIQPSRYVTPKQRLCTEVGSSCNLYQDGSNHYLKKREHMVFNITEESLDNHQKTWNIDSSTFPSKRDGNSASIQVQFTSKKTGIQHWFKYISLWRTTFVDPRSGK